MKRLVFRLVSDSLQVRKCAEEVRTPRRCVVAATELRDFWFCLLLKPKAREVSS